MVTISDTTKSDTSILIDGIRFSRVHFRDCELIYSAEDEAEFEDCTFEDVSWSFSGAAERTIAFLAMLNRNTGTKGQTLVDSIFRTIKDASVTRIRVPLATASASALPPKIAIG